MNTGGRSPPIFLTGGGGGAPQAPPPPVPTPMITCLTKDSSEARRTGTGVLQ